MKWLQTGFFWHPIVVFNQYSPRMKMKRYRVTRKRENSASLYNYQLETPHGWSREWYTTRWSRDHVTCNFVMMFFYLRNYGLSVEKVFGKQEKSTTLAHWSEYPESQTPRVPYPAILGIDEDSVASSCVGLSDGTASTYIIRISMNWDHDHDHYHYLPHQLHHLNGRESELVIFRLSAAFPHKSSR